MTIDISSIGPNAGATAMFVYDEDAKQWVPASAGGAPGPAGDVFVKNAELNVKVSNFPTDTTNKVEVTNFPEPVKYTPPADQLIHGEVHMTNFRLPDPVVIPDEMAVHGVVQVSNFPEPVKTMDVNVLNFPAVPAPIVNVPAQPAPVFPTRMQVNGVVTIDNLPEQLTVLDVHLHEQDADGNWVPVKQKAEVFASAPTEDAPKVQQVSVVASEPMQVVGKFWQTTQGVRDGEVIDLLTEILAELRKGK